MLLTIILIALSGLHAHAKLDKLSLERVNEYIQKGLLPANTAKDSIGGLWFDRDIQEWRTGVSKMEAAYERFSQLGAGDISNWNYSDPDSQFFLYWLNDIALSRESGNLHPINALDMLQKIINERMKSYEGLFIPLEAVLNSKNPSTIRISLNAKYGDIYTAKCFDWSGVDMDRLSSDNPLKLINSFASTASADPRGYFNPATHFKNFDTGLFLSGKFLLEGSYDFSGFSSDEISNINPSVVQKVTGWKLDPNKSLYNSQGKYILANYNVAGVDFSNFPEMDIALMKATSYKNCIFPRMNLDGSEDFTGANWDFCSIEKFTGLTQAQLVQIGKLENIRITGAQYNQFKDFFVANRSEIRKIYVDGEVNYMQVKPEAN